MPGAKPPERSLRDRAGRGPHVSCHRRRV